MIYATVGLADTLLSFAADHDPDGVSVPLAVTPAGDFDAQSQVAAGLSPETPVFTHFYLPEAAGSVNAVFGVDLGTPAGQTQGRFVSHPDGRLGLARTDDLHEVVFVAVPPWTRDDVAPFDREGRRLDIRLVDVEPPRESPP